MHTQLYRIYIGSDGGEVNSKRHIPLVGLSVLGSLRTASIAIVQSGVNDLTGPCTRAGNSTAEIVEV